MLQHPLNDATSIRVSGKTVNLPSEGFDDKLNISSRDSFDGLLNDMVPVLVLHALENMTIKLSRKGGLLVGQDMLQSL